MNINQSGMGSKIMLNAFKNILIKYNIIFYICIVIFQNNIYAKSDMCDYKNNDFNLELSKYKIRINDFIEKNIYITNCDILYGYNKILGNEELMNKFEENPSNFQQFSEFIINYPKTVQFINNYKEFENFNKFSSKDIIEKVLSKINLNNKDKKSNLVFLMALSFQFLNNINENSFENDLNEINKYSEKDLEVIIPFWNVYINFYSESQNMMKYEKFSKIINEISISTLKEYSHRQEFFIYFLSSKNSLEYTKTIKLLLDKKEIKEKYLLSFITQISFDINDAIDKGLKANEIVSYLQPFTSDKILMETFYKNACDNQNNTGIETAIITQSLSDKISFKKENEEIFSDIIKLLKKEINESGKIVMLSYYNFMLRIYNELENKEQKNILIDLYKNFTNDKTFNMRAITILYQYTSYFSDIANDNWKNKEYRNILYIEQSENSPLKYLNDTNPETIQSSVKSLNEMIYTLIRTPKENLNDSTTKEIFDNTLEVIDIASDITLIIPGAGIAINVAKKLAVQSIKTAIKQGVKKIGEKTVKVLKNYKDDYFDNRIKYGDGRRKLSKNINNLVKNADRVEDTAGLVGLGSIVYGLYNYYFEEKNQKSICGEEN